MSITAIRWAWEAPIKAGPKFVLVALAEHANDNGDCWPSLATLSRKCGMSRSCVSVHLKQLENAKFITKSYRRKHEGRRASNLYKLSINAHPESLSKELQRPDPGNIDPESGPRLVQDLDGYINHHKETPKNQSKKFVSCDGEEIKTVFLFWQKQMEYPKAKLDKKRKQHISQALKLGFSLDELKLAIEGCAKTPFNMGQNDNQQRYDDISLILRDAGQIERFIAQAKGSPKLAIVNNLPHLSKFNGVH